MRVLLFITLTCTIVSAAIFTETAIGSTTEICTNDDTIAPRSDLSSLPLETRLVVANPGSNKTQQTFLRFVNPNNLSTSIEVYGIDDGGNSNSNSPIRFNLAPNASKQFNAQDMENGSPNKGLESNFCNGQGKWQLLIRSDNPVKVMGLIRTPDGFLTSLSDVVPKKGNDNIVYFANPASNHTQQTFLRIVNLSASSGTVRIIGTDDEGMTSNGTITFTMAPNESKQINAQELENGSASKGLTGNLGNGTGKWRLKVSSSLSLAVLSLIRTPDGFLTNLSGMVAENAFGDHVIFFANPASDTGKQTFLRIINTSGQTGTVAIAGIDDKGNPAPGGNVLFDLGPNESKQMNAQDLELGNSGKGLSGMLGDGDGRWRLIVSAGIDIKVMSLVRTPDGFLTNLSRITPEFENTNDVFFFNPASNTNQVSSLRIVNDTNQQSSVSISGIDDNGQIAPGGDVSFDILPNRAINITAQDLEQGNALKGLTGALGDGAGKWRLLVTSNISLTVQGLMNTPSGFLTNISSVISTTMPVQFTFDAFLTNNLSVDASGALLTLDVPQGPSFTLDIPVDALPTNTEISMQGVDEIQNFPQGYRPIAAVRIQSSGANFLGWPILTINPRDVAISGPQLIGFLSNDDGSKLIFLPLRTFLTNLGSSLDAPLEILLPHFSVAGIAETLNTGDLEIGPPPPGADAGERALHFLAQRMSEWEKNLAADLPDNFIVDSEAFDSLKDWINNPVDGMKARANALLQGIDPDNTSPLKDFVLDLEIIRFELVGMILGSEALEFELFDDMDQMARQVATAYFEAIAQNCVEDTQLAFDRTLDLGVWLGTSIFTNDELGGDQPCRIGVTFDPSFRAITEGADAEFDVVVTFEDGSTPDISIDDLPAPSSVSQEPLGMSFDVGHMTFTPNNTGFLKLEVNTEIGEIGVATVAVVPDLTGSYSGVASGSTFFCEDEDDEGFGVEFGQIFFGVQSIQSASISVANVRLNGSGADATSSATIDLDIALTEITESTASGSVSGSATYTETEIEEDDEGNLVTFTTNGSLTLNGQFSNGVFQMKGQGSDNFCSKVTGNLILTPQ